MAIYKNTSQGQPQLAMMIRIFCVCGEGRGREESLDQWTTLWWWPQLLKSVSTRTPGQSCYMLSHQFQWNFASLKGLPQNSRRQTGFCFGFFRGEIDHPPVFLGFHQGNRFKIGKMYEALTAMVFDQLLWGFAHIFLHP